MTRESKTLMETPHPIVTVMLAVGSILVPLALAALAGCQAAHGATPAATAAPRIEIVCQDDTPEEMSPPMVEAISLDRLPANCRWQGTSFPIFGRRAAGSSPVRYDAVYYRPLLRPLGSPRIDSMSDATGSTVRIDLETQLPSLGGLCDGVGNLPARLLDGAQPLAVYALDVSFESPIIPGQCHLRLPGSVHHVGGSEVVRLRFSSAADAESFISTVTSDPSELALRIRYAVAGVVNVPTTSFDGAGGTPLAVAWFEETVRGTRSCEDYCDGCCDERGTCHEPATLTTRFCALDEPGGACGACPAFSLCDEAVCRDAGVADAIFDVTLSSVRIEGYSNCDTFSACDFTAMVSWYSLNPGLSNSGGGGPNDSDRAWVGVSMARSAQVAPLLTPFGVTVYDRDVTEDEYMTDCSLMLERSDLQRAVDAARRYDSLTLDWACGRGIYLSFSVHAQLADDDRVVAAEW